MLSKTLVMIVRVHSLIKCILVFYTTAISHIITWPLDFVIITRSEWLARPPIVKPRPIPHSNFPVPYVIIHHSALDNNCSNLACSTIVKQYQDFHIDERHWHDIGYNFLIDQEGNIYEGRGWGIVGAHAKAYNNKSVGICFIGNFEELKPTFEALTSAKTIINYGITTGEISHNYILHGHRQVRKNSTDCPGENIFSVIKTWPHFENTTEKF